MQRNHGPRPLEHRRKPEAPLGKSFEFITFNDPKQARKADTRRLVRRKAMRDVLERSRISSSLTPSVTKPKVIPPHVEGLPHLAPRPSQPEISSSVQDSAENRSAREQILQPESQPDDEEPEREIPGNDETRSSAKPTAGPVTLLGAGRIDPFAIYPCESTDPHLDGVVDYYHTGYHQFKLPRDVWFVIGLTDPAAFYQLLSTSAAVRAHMRKEKEDTLALKYRIQAIRSVNQRLSDPKVTITEGLVGAIIAFLCYDYKLDHFETWKKDMRGLQNIVRLRGGIETLNHNAVLRVLLTWTDLMGSNAMDRPAHFPFPVEIAPSTVAKSSDWNLQSIQSSLPSELKQTYTDQPYLANICRSLSVLITSIKERFGVDEIWLDEMFFAVEVNAVFHRLLGVPRIDEPASLAEVMQESYRLSSLIYIGKIFEYANVGPWYHRRHANKLKLRLCQHDVVWGRFDPMRLWALSLGALGADEEYDRPWFYGEIRRLCHSMDINSWSAVSEVLFSLPWMHGMFRQELMDLFVDILN